MNQALHGVMSESGSLRASTGLSQPSSGLCKVSTDHDW